MLLTYERKFVMHTLGEDYLTVAEAAEALHVGQSTIRRWIRQDMVPAYRIGKRRIALKRSDVGLLITRANVGPESEGSVANSAIAGIPQRLTPAQQRQGLAAIEDARRLQAELLASRGGQLFSPSS